MIAQICVGNRPSRIEPIAVKRRPKSYPLLMKPREEAWADVKKYGHHLVALSKCHSPQALGLCPR